jgi:sulfate transporter 3
VDFLSKATLTGFMGGAAIIVSLQQLKGLLGIVHFTSHMGFVDVMRSVFKRHDEVRTASIDDMRGRRLALSPAACR